MFFVQAEEFRPQHGIPDQSKYIFYSGIPSDCLTVAETHRDDLPHYAEASMDFVYNMKWSAKPGGTLTESPKEICGLAFRGCFDLTKHQKVWYILFAVSLR